MNKKYFDILREFMNMSIFSADEVFEKFLTDKGGTMFEVEGHKFYFKPGTRDDKILIVAHADTVWDTRYNPYLAKLQKFNHLPQKENYLVESSDSYSSSDRVGIGADDRAGAAMAWILKDSGNSILITDEEEIGAQTSQAIMRNKEWADVINSHRYILQLDLNGSKEFKCYGAGSEDFKTMMEMVTRYEMRPNFSYTDVKYLGKKICGANISIGYYDEHTENEKKNKKQWLSALKTAYKLSKQKHQQFIVEEDFGEKYSYDALLSQIAYETDNNGETIFIQEDSDENEMQ